MVIIISFRRKSVQHFTYLVPKEALDPHDVSEKIERMYFWIRRLSDSAFVLCGEAQGRLPLSDLEISQLESLTTNQPFPTALNALHQLLGVPISGDIRSRIREWSLEAIPYMHIVRAVTSMTVYNVIFQEDPFIHELQTAILIRVLEQDQSYSEYLIRSLRHYNYTDFWF